MRWTSSTWGVRDGHHNLWLQALIYYIVLFNVHHSSNGHRFSADLHIQNIMCCHILVVSAGLYSVVSLHSLFLLLIVWPFFFQTSMATVLLQCSGACWFAQSCTVCIYFATLSVQQRCIWSHLFIWGYHTIVSFLALIFLFLTQMLHLYW